MLGDDDVSLSVSERLPTKLGFLTGRYEEDVNVFTAESTRGEVAKD